MTTAKIFQHGGSQAVRLPKAFRFPGSEVLIEKHGDEVVLRPVTHSQFKSFTEIARHLAEAFPDSDEFPEPPARPSTHERGRPIAAQARSLGSTLVTGNAKEFKRVKGLKVMEWKPA